MSALRSRRAPWRTQEHWIDLSWAHWKSCDSPVKWDCGVHFRNEETEAPPGSETASQVSELGSEGSGVPLMLCCGQKHPCHLKLTCEFGCICRFITTKGLQRSPLWRASRVQIQPWSHRWRNQAGFRGVDQGRWGGSSHEQILTHFLAIKAESRTEKRMFCPFSAKL